MMRTIMSAEGPKQMIIKLIKMHSRTTWGMTDEDMVVKYCWIQRR